MHRRRRLHRAVGGAARQGRATPRARSSLLEAETIGSGASGRNGGFFDASLTHGLENGLARFADEMETLERLGPRELRRPACRPRAARDRLRLRGDRRARPVAARAPPGRLAGGGRRAARRFGHDVEVLDGEAMRAEVASPTYRGGIWDRPAPALVDPGKLATGLREAALRARRAGVRAHAGAGLRRRATACVEVAVTAARAARAASLLATSAFPPLLRALRRYVVPVYDYVLVTEPLDRRRSARRSAGARRQGIGDVRQPVPLLPADRRRPDPLRRLRRRLPLRRPGRARAATSTTRPSPRSRSTSSRPSRSSRGCASPTAGAARSTPAAASRSSSAPPTAAASPTRSATPASASPPPASAPASRSTCSTAARPRRRGCATCAPSPSRSRPSRCAGRSSSSPATGSRPPTATRGPPRPLAADARPARARVRQLS